MKDGQKSISGFIILVVCIFLLVQCVNNSSANLRQQEQKAFETQLHKDPSKWDKKEKQRYNDFVDWQIKQKNK